MSLDRTCCPGNNSTPTYGKAVMGTAGCTDFCTAGCIDVHIIRSIIMMGYACMGLVIAVLHADSVNYLDESVARYVVLSLRVCRSLIYSLAKRKEFTRSVV